MRRRRIRKLALGSKQRHFYVNKHEVPKTPRIRWRIPISSPTMSLVQLHKFIEVLKWMIALSIRSCSRLPRITCRNHSLPHATSAEVAISFPLATVKRVVGAILPQEDFPITGTRHMPRFGHEPSRFSIADDCWKTHRITRRKSRSRKRHLCDASAAAETHIPSAAGITGRRTK